MVWIEAYVIRHSGCKRGEPFRGAFNSQRWSLLVPVPEHVNAAEWLFESAISIFFYLLEDERFNPEAFLLCRMSKVSPACQYCVHPINMCHPDSNCKCTIMLVEHQEGLINLHLYSKCDKIFPCISWYLQIYLHSEDVNKLFPY